MVRMVIYNSSYRRHFELVLNRQLSRAFKARDLDVIRMALLDKKPKTKGKISKAKKQAYERFINILFARGYVKQTQPAAGKRNAGLESTTVSIQLDDKEEQIRRAYDTRKWEGYLLYEFPPEKEFGMSEEELKKAFEYMRLGEKYEIVRFPVSKNPRAPLYALMCRDGIIRCYDQRGRPVKTPKDFYPPSRDQNV